MSKKPEIVYYYRGMIERYSQASRGRWIRGYSANGPNGGQLCPWQGKRVCQAEAKKLGCKAVFVE